MDLITIDFETFYSKDFSLSKMTTEEYIRSPEFETIGVSVKVGSEDAEWFSGTKEQTKKFLQKFDWDNAIAIAHNAMFDMAILNWHFDIRPKKIADTLSMARPIHGTEVGGSLSALVTHYGLGQKGTEVIDALGKRRIDFTEEELAKYGEYCINDVELTYKLFCILVGHIRPSELNLIDLTIRMFTEPMLQLDKTLLASHLKEVVEKKDSLLAKALIDTDDLRSNPKLAEVLKNLGVEPPMKISPTTGKETFAFAKTDEEFKALLEHDNIIVQAIVAARLGVKSTLEETRTQRFIDIADRGTLPIPLRYYAAHTGRWGGDGKLNLQNLPRGSDLKKSILAPEGYVVIDCDSSQIEARILAWFAGQEDLVTAFERGEDVYKQMASAIYNKPEASITKEERFVGKTTILGCFGADTLVLTSSGWKRIVEVQSTDTLWDGEEWVNHQGVIPQGVKQTIRALGVNATPDHEILTEHGWRVWSEVTTNPSLTQSAINKGSLPSQIGSSILNQRADQQGGTLSSGVRVDGKGRLIDTTSRQDAPPDATPVRSRLLTELANITGGMKVSSLMRRIAHGYLTVSQAVSQGAIDLLVKRIPIMGGEVFSFTSRGVQIEPPSYATLYHCPDGMTPSVTSTVSITERGTNLTTYALQRALKTQKTSEPLELCKQRLMTYDIAYAGPRNRYTIATTAGALIVHNCGYGMGALRFQAQLKNFGVELPIEECERIITVYRQKYAAIPALWRQANNAITAMMQNQSTPLGITDVISVQGREGIKLPNGLYLKYPNLRRVRSSDGNDEVIYDVKKGKATTTTKLYGGKLVENVCQALARIIIGGQMSQVAKKYRVVLTVHDAIACVAPEAEAEEARAYVEKCMRTRPDWAPDLPLNCESGVGRSYGEC